MNRPPVHAIFTGILYLTPLVVDLKAHSITVEHHCGTVGLGGEEGCDGGNVAGPELWLLGIWCGGP